MMIPIKEGTCFADLHIRKQIASNALRVSCWRFTAVAMMIVVEAKEKRGASIAPPRAGPGHRSGHHSIKRVGG